MRRPRAPQAQPAHRHPGRFAIRTRPASPRRPARRVRPSEIGPARCDANTRSFDPPQAPARRPLASTAGGFWYHSSGGPTSPRRAPGPGVPPGGRGADPSRSSAPRARSQWCGRLDCRGEVHPLRAGLARRALGERRRRGAVRRLGRRARAGHAPGHTLRRRPRPAREVADLARGRASGRRAMRRRDSRAPHSRRRPRRRSPAASPTCPSTTRRRSESGGGSWPTRGDRRQTGMREDLRWVARAAGLLALHACSTPDAPTSTPTLPPLDAQLSEATGDAEREGLIRSTRLSIIAGLTWTGMIFVCTRRG